MWSERVDSSDSIAKVWPRSAAMAGRLWSLEAFAANEGEKGNPNAAVVNLASWVCKMRARNFQVDPIGNSPAVDPVVPFQDGTDLIQWQCPGVVQAGDSVSIGSNWGIPSANDDVVTLEI